MAGRALIVAALCPLVFTFSDTFPIIAWSSYASSALDSLPAKVTHSISILESVLFHEDICAHDAVVIIDQPGLHASDLRTLSPSSNLARILASAPSSRQFPYVSRTPAAPSSLSSVAESVSTRCGSRLVALTPDQGGITFDAGLKHVVRMSMPHLGGTASSRKTTMVKHESDLFKELNLIASVFPKHLVVFTGSASLLSKRQMPYPSNFSKVDSGGILKRYQLLTPGLIVTLLVSFFIIGPVVFLGISALASIQSPLRLDLPKGYNAQTKKNI